MPHFDRTTLSKVSARHGGYHQQCFSEERQSVPSL